MLVLRHPDRYTVLQRGEMTTIDSRIVILSCPWFLVGRSVAVQWVSEAYEWRETGALQWGALPVPARCAVTAFGRGVSRRRMVDLEREREKQDAQRDRVKVRTRSR